MQMEKDKAEGLKRRKRMGRRGTRSIYTSIQPQTVTLHKPHTPIEHLARGRLWVDSWSIFGQFRSKMTKTDQKATENRLKTD